MQNLNKKLHPNKLKPLRKLRKIAIVGVAFVFVITAVLFSINKTQAQSQATTTSTSTTSSIAEKQRQLEQRYQELLLEIKEQESIVSEIRGKERTIQGEINQLDARINSLNLQLEAVKLNIQRLNQNITETQRNINRTQNQIKDHKEALAESLQRVYETDKQSLIAILLKNDKISDFFNSVNNILLVQNNIRSSLNEVVNLRQELIKEKQDLSQEKGNIENLKAVRQSQKQQVTQVQSRKERVLAATEAERKQQQEILQETRKTAAEIRNQIFKLIGGEELTFEKAYQIAKFAEDETGVRAALIMAIVSRESNFGRNTGTCNRPGDDLKWQDIMPGPEDLANGNSWRDDQSIFLAITDNLGISPNGTPLSCPLGNGWGGAMGPSQFIPSTWALYGGYEKENGEWAYNKREDEIRKATGSSKPSNPWDNRHALMATALLINDNYESRGCREYAESLDHKYPKQELQEECAAAKYYAGGNWKKEYHFYGIPVVSKADEIQQDIDIISS